MVTVVVKSLARAGAATDVLVKVLTIGGLINVVNALEVAAPVSYSVDVLTGYTSGRSSDEERP